MDTDIEPRSVGLAEIEALEDPFLILIRANSTADPVSGNGEKQHEILR